MNFIGCKKKHCQGPPVARWMHESKLQGAKCRFPVLSHLERISEPPRMGALGWTPLEARIEPRAAAAHSLVGRATYGQLLPHVKGWPRSVPCVVGEQRRPLPALEGEIGLE